MKTTITLRAVLSVAMLSFVSFINVQAQAQAPNLGNGDEVLKADYIAPENLKGSHTKAGVRAAMNHLIDRATHFDVDALESIYHKDFHTTLVMPDDSVKTYSKPEFITHFRKQAQAGKNQLSTWAKWHDFQVLGDSAVSVLTRKHSGMNGREMILLCNIEWRFENGRWQVLREQIFLRPLS